VEGSIIGTVSYMSPEQAQGKKVDARSDIFSFAVVLYEMVTGTRAFAGDSALSTLSAILRDETRPIPEIAPDTPPQLEHVINRCLRKHPDQRFQTMKEVQTALGALKHASDSGMLYRTRVEWSTPAKRSTLPLGMTCWTGVPGLSSSYLRGEPGGGPIGRPKSNRAGGVQTTSLRPGPRNRLPALLRRRRAHGSSAHE
jgi:serine/threonine-protein kinase